MEEKAADELVGAQRHRLLLGAMAIILPAEAHLAIVDAEQAMIGDGDSMRVAADVVEDLLRSGEGRFGEDDPIGPTNQIQIASERRQIRE